MAVYGDWQVSLWIEKIITCIEFVWDDIIYFMRNSQETIEALRQAKQAI